MDKIRAVCERAVKAAGYHVTQGYIVWDTYREFENAILAGLQVNFKIKIFFFLLSSNLFFNKESLAGTTNAKPIEESINQQMKRIENIFKAQLKASLEQMESTYEEFKQFDESMIDEECEKNYKASLAKLKELEPYETNLV